MPSLYHQVVAAVLVHPITKQVISLAVEPIIRSDGNAKNDCERNATSRLLRRLRQQHPKLNMLIIEDGLSSNAPHIADLEENKMHYLLGAKPGDHQHLFAQVIEEMEDDNYRCETYQVALAEGMVRTETSYVSGVSLNKTHTDVQVNFLQHHEFNISDGAIIKQFSWVTDLDLSQKSLHEYQKASRCRWRVENETFNALKNQGYCLEHNYGHG